ncbi:hypothetical protein [Opitutus terrae]|uniref:Uncharacterized protein n=1 Tax=Opitutus terrae (strain DSM 11246 / JCM 15787 / PB90-1) TaxID=452637 RepID=B1ZTQ4_OPITP|nr:hypothetical protein [Opitutus terrae]ACB74840.1 hypothetical protein Oter_1556 [Opitutus terrae PB90-1]
MKSPEQNDLFADVLADWRVQPPRDPNFRAAVWARIAATSRGLSWAGYARTHLAALAGALALALLLGGWAGREQARSVVAADRAEIAATYVQTLDARAMWEH